VGDAHAGDAQAGSTQAEQATPRRRLRTATEESVERDVSSVSLPFFGTVVLPPVDHLAWYAGVGILTAVELIEWPVALALTVGKALADSRSHRTLRVLGEALEDAE